MVFSLYFSYIFGFILTFVLIPGWSAWKLYGVPLGEILPQSMRNASSAKRRHTSRPPALKEGVNESMKHVK
jgi:hypothetical protein